MYFFLEGVNTKLLMNIIFFLQDVTYDFATHFQKMTGLTFCRQLWWGTY